MLKRAWILPLLMLIAVGFAALVPARAADDAFQRRPPTAYRDLPGVVPQQDRVRTDSYSCTTDIEEVYVGRGRYRILNGDVAPRRVYRCESENGVTYSGTQPPNTHWVPGLNPLHLPK
ncbi:hypothetical protein ACWGPT_03960 [Pseudorhizobium sp. NPDC055634]